MRIVGDNSQKLEKEVTCRECGAIIAYMPVDVITEKHTDYRGDSDYYNIIVCPKCNSKITIGVK